MLPCCLLALAWGFPQAGRADPRPAPLPWHLADFYVDIGFADPFESLSVDLLVLDDVPREPWLFFNPLGGQLHRNDFYCGLMTLVPDAYQTNGQYGIRVAEVARGAAFTRWGDMLRESVRPGQTGWWVVSDHEGKLASVKHVHPWRKGLYTVKLARMDAEPFGDSWYRWVGAFLTDHATGFTGYLGALRFPGREPVLDRTLTAFVEAFGTPGVPPPAPDTLPPVRLVVGNWRVNNAPVTPKTVDVVYPTAVPRHARAVPAERFWAECGEKPPKGAPTGRGAFAVTVGPKPVDRPAEERLYPPPGK